MLGCDGGSSESGRGSSRWKREEGFGIPSHPLAAPASSAASLSVWQAVNIVVTVQFQAASAVEVVVVLIVVVKVAGTHGWAMMAGSIRRKWL